MTDLIVNEVSGLRVVAYAGANSVLLGTHGTVLDKTGLTGSYDFELSWDEEAGPSLSTALREQLGLRLEPQKDVPGSFFIVDSAQKPEAN